MQYRQKQLRSPVKRNPPKKDQLKEDPQDEEVPGDVLQEVDLKEDPQDADHHAEEEAGGLGSVEDQDMLIPMISL